MKVISDLKAVSVNPGFRKLLLTRLISQCGDGAFQVGLAALFFFSPQMATTAKGVALAFTVLLLPFTIVGPFAGPLLDRWRRRQVLYWGNLVRMSLAVVIAGIMVTVGIHPAIYVLALVTLGVNRFLLSALSAGLPHVVPANHLLTANSITPTLGGVAAVVGAVGGFIINRLTPEGVIRDAISLLSAATLFLLASLAATRLGRDQLGPREKSSAHSESLGRTLARTIIHMGNGARYLIARRTPAYGLVVMCVHRFLYGTSFIALLLISRNLLADPADPDQGLTIFALLSGISFMGNGIAIITTPLAQEYMRPSKWIGLCLGLGMVSQALAGLTWHIVPLAIAACGMGWSVQGAKIAVDTIVQRDVTDRYRGRAFSWYDMLFNAAFVGAAALAATALPDTGWSRAVFTSLALAYLALASWYHWATTRIDDEALEVHAA